jgi:hypothetical protein
MGIDAEELTGGGGDDLVTLKLEPGDTWTGLLVDIDSTPHWSFDNPDVQEVDRSGRPKTKWVVRLRPDGTTDASEDLKFWAQNQVKFSLRQTIADHPTNYRGARIKIERLDDAQPRQKGYKGAAQYRFTLKAGPDGWVDPLAQAATSIMDDEEPF